MKLSMRPAATLASETCFRPIYMLCLAAFVGMPAARAVDLSAATKSPPHVLENPLAAVSLNELAATRQRPLFSPSRRPPAVVTTNSRFVPPAPVSVPPKLTLEGVVIDTNGSVAIVRLGFDGKIRRVRRGDELDEWRVTQIKNNSLIIARDDRSLTVSMFKPAQSTKVAMQLRPPGRGPEVNTEALQSLRHR